MIDHEINEFVRIISSLSLNQSKKERIAKYLTQKNNERKETSRILGNEGKKTS